MGRKLQEKPNYEKQFERLYKEHHISGNSEMLKRMYERYYRQKGYEEGWIERSLPDFGKKIKGDGRTFTDMDILAIERAVGMSFVDIVEPLTEGATNKATKEYEPRGWRYAACLDEKWYYDKMCSEAESHYDEYGKSVIDYILEYRALNGLRYLVDKGALHLDDCLYVNESITYSKAPQGYIEWIFELDDAEMFMKMFSNESIFNVYYEHNEEASNSFFEKFIKSNAIFDAVLKYEGVRQEYDRELAYKPGILLGALKYALAKKENTVAQMIINSYRKYLDEQSEMLRRENALRENNPRLSLIDSGLQLSLYVDNQQMAYFWNIELLKHDGEFKEQLEELDANTVLNNLFAKDLAKMQEGEEFIKDGVYYIKKSDCLALEAIKYLSGVGCDAVPKYLGEKEGVTMLSAYRKNYYFYNKESEAAVAEILGKIHRYSKEKLGDGKVYSYANRLSLGSCGDGKNVISNWQSCKIGTVISDITLVLLANFTDPLNYDEYSCLFTTYHNNTFERLCSFLDAYPDKDAIRCFGDALNAEVESMIANALEQNNKGQVINLHLAKGFAEVYRSDLNKRTEGSDKEV